MYSARKMRDNEFKTLADVLRRDAQGALCSFAVEHSSGAKEIGLSWKQACQIAAERNDLAENAA